MKVLHINQGKPQTVLINGKDVSTGIYKEPVTTPLTVHALGLEGDGQADLTVHGGPYQALYAYPFEHYSVWQRELAVDLLPPGTFGENLTVSGLLETDVCIGDVHRIGEIIVQVTSARIPCFKLGHKLSRPDILKRFLQSGRSGYYLRVLQSGTIAPGCEIEVIERDPNKITVRQLLGLHRLGEGDRDSLKAAIEITALAPIVRADLETRLAKLSS